MAKKTAKKKAPAKKATKKAASTTKKAKTKKAAAEKDGDAPAKKKKATKKKKTTRAKTKEIRLKAYWGVFNQSLKRVALFEFNERKQAEKKAADLGKNGKSPHFVQPVKEAIEA